MGCFCAVPEEFYCEVLLLDESKLTLTTQQQGIKVGAGRGRVRGIGSQEGSGGPWLSVRAVTGWAGNCVAGQWERTAATARAQVEGGRVRVG